MKYSFMSASFMLVAVILLNLTDADNIAHAAGGLSHQRHLRGRSDASLFAAGTGSDVSPCTGASCVNAQPKSHNLPCNDANGTVFVAGTTNDQWTMLCDIDFFAQDIYPFISAGSFEECLLHCDNHNQQGYVPQCAGFVFAPDRIGLENDCYLKSSTNNAVEPSTIHLVGATILPKPSNHSPSAVEPTASTGVSDKLPGDSAASKFPDSLQVKALGISTDDPTTQYVSHPAALPRKLAAHLLEPGINIDLITKFGLASDTGSWTESTAPFDFELANLTVAPKLSRDGGKGGNINGTHIFYFCDTSTFGNVEGPLGYMNGFVSSSAAVDVSRNALYGKALELQSPIGQWQDDVGRLRGWIPMTVGEESFNIAVSGDGFRYAVWPESSFIPLNSTNSLIYAPLVYVDVDMKTQHADFTSLGNTLVSVTVDPKFGPHADRIVNQMFTQDEVEWGSLGGIRQWTKSGVGSNDGMLYLLGQVEEGILLAKVPAIDFVDRSAYTYWNGTSWSSSMPTKNSTAYVVKQPVMDVDMFYIGYHRTFVMIYLTPFADNTIYLRKLVLDHDLIPAYETGGVDNYVEYILRYPWSDPYVVVKPDIPASGYIYAAGCHLGYFGSEDYANGGHKLLITWTEHTPKDPNNPASGYVHKSIVIDG